MGPRPAPKFTARRPLQNGHPSRSPRAGENPPPLPLPLGPCPWRLRRLPELIDLSCGRGPGNIRLPRGTPCIRMGEPVGTFCTAGSVASIVSPLPHLACVWKGGCYHRLSLGLALSYCLGYGHSVSLCRSFLCYSLWPSKAMPRFTSELSKVDLSQLRTFPL